jgi:hypothetical protein
MTYETKLFYLPNSGLIEDYKFIELSHIVYGGYYVSLPFAMDEEGFAETIFVFHNRTWTETGNYPVNMERPMLIGEISQVLDNDEIPVYRIQNFNMGGVFYHLTHPNSNADILALKPGDVVFAALTGATLQGAPSKIQTVQDGRIYNYMKKISLSAGTSYYVQSDSVYGKVSTIRADVRKNKIVVDLDCGIDGFKSFNIFGQNTYLFNRTTKKVSLATAGAIKSAENYGNADASEIFVNFNSEEKINMVVIVIE